MARQGRFFSDYEIRTIKGLLLTTDLSIGFIAERMGCSSSAVASINRKYQVRNYQGRRSNWTIESENLIPASSPNQNAATPIFG
jgi:hypothetical protein